MWIAQSATFVKCKNTKHIFVRYLEVYMFRKKIVYDTVYVKTITDDTKSNMEKVKALSDNYVIKNAKKANKLIEEMKNKTDKEKVEKKKIHYFVKQLKDIIKFYEYVTDAKRVESTKKELVEYYESTKCFYNDIDKILSNLNTELSTLNGNLNNLGTDNTRETDVKKQSLDSQILFTNKAIQMLNDFKSCYSNLMPTLKKVQDDVNFFVLAITESVKVYKKAVQVAELSQTITNAMDTIKQLNELNKLSTQITESWQNLASIMKKLTDIQQSIAA